MKLFKKTTMSLALSAAMIGGLAMSQQANALPDPGAGVSHFNPNGVGQVLTFPYYSVRGGLKSFFNLTNTGGDTIAVKVRFHESGNSRDALDFNMVLSPYDVWTGWIEAGPAIGDAPVVKTLDNSCVVGAPSIKTTGQPLSNVAYGDLIPSFEDLGSNSIDRTREGYVEVIVMGKVTSVATDAAINPLYNETISTTIGTNAWAGSVAYNAWHVNGVPRNCAAVDSAFVAPASAPQTLPVAFPFTDNGTAILGDGDAAAILEFEALDNGDNPLKGNFSIINSGTGIGAGNAATALADWMTLAPATPGINLITAQNFPYFLEPTIASGDGLWTVSGLADVEAALNSTGIDNEWAFNSASGAQTDWIVTFPTKGFHVDHFDSAGVNVVDNIQASNNQWRVGAAALVGSGVFEDNMSASGAPVQIALTGYDREELGIEATTGNTTPSPFPPGGVTTLALTGEANVISFSPTGTASALGAESFVLNFDISSTLSSNPPNGWTSLNFLFAGVAQPFPATGFAFKSRNQGDASLSFGQILNHAWH